MNSHYHARQQYRSEESTYSVPQNASVLVAYACVDHCANNIAEKWGEASTQCCLYCEEKWSAQNPKAVKYGKSPRAQSEYVTVLSQLFRERVCEREGLWRGS